MIGGIVPGAIFAVIPSYVKSPAQVSLLVGLFMQGAAIGQATGTLSFGYFIELVNENWNWGLGFYAVVTILGGLLMFNVKPLKPEA